MMKRNEMGEEKVNTIPCHWQEQKNNKDWYYVSCINQKVNIWKLAKKKHLSMVQIFLSCPYCKGKVVIK